MLSYLIVIIRFTNFRIDCTQMKKLTEMKTSRWTQEQKKIFKNQHCCQCWSPRYRVSVLSTKCGGYHPKGLIVASSYKIKKNININFNVPVPILLFMKQEKKNQLNFYFIPLVPLTKNLENM